MRWASWAAGLFLVLFLVLTFWAGGRGVRSDLPTLGRLPEFTATAVTTVSERAFSSAELGGHPWVAGFIFTSCAGPCPALTSNMARLQGRLPKEVKLLSFTVDPDRDSPEVLKAYAARFAADPGRWYFLTAGKARLYPLLRQGFKLAAVEDPGAPSGLRVTHSTKLVLVDSEGRIRGYYDGDDRETLERLVQDAAFLCRRLP